MCYELVLRIELYNYVIASLLRKAADNVFTGLVTGSGRIPAPEGASLCVDKSY